MLDNISKNLQLFYTENILQYWNSLNASPLNIILFIIDIVCVLYLFYKLLRVVKKTRAWQLLKGILVLIIATILSGVFQLKILNFILTSFMTYGVIILIVVFQPELRRALEQLGTGKLSSFFGFDKDIAAKTKENIYKVVIACVELAKKNTGALIVFERDIKIQDIINTGIIMDSDISPQLLVNIFEPNTPLHDGAVIVRGNRITAATCYLPLSDNMSIGKELGTRHRAGVGISEATDSMTLIVSEETGKISVAYEGHLESAVDSDRLRERLRQIQNKPNEDHKRRSRKGKAKA